MKITSVGVLLVGIRGGKTCPHIFIVGGVGLRS